MSASDRAESWIQLLTEILEAARLELLLAEIPAAQTPRKKPCKACIIDRVNNPIRGDE
jgi:hypothetical protein